MIMKSIRLSNTFLTLISAGILAAGLSACSDTGTGLADSSDYEVWFVDQSDSPGQNFGGTVHIYDGAGLSGDEPANAREIDRIDLAGAPG
jgi:hypothetical protein